MFYSKKKWKYYMCTEILKYFDKECNKIASWKRDFGRKKRTPQKFMQNNDVLANSGQFLRTMAHFQDEYLYFVPHRRDVNNNYVQHLIVCK